MLTISDLLKELLHSRTAERGCPHHHLVQYHTHGPPVHWVAIAQAQNDLWCDVVRCTVHLSVVELTLVRLYHVCRVYRREEGEGAVRSREKEGEGAVRSREKEGEGGRRSSEEQ